MSHKILSSLLVLLSSTTLFAQQPVNDVTTPLHAMRPGYPVPYDIPTEQNVRMVLDKVFNYLDASTPAAVVNKQTHAVVTDPSQADSNLIVQQGDFRLTSYEWGVTYSGMLLAKEITGDSRFSDYVKKRLDLIAQWVPAIKKELAAGKLKNNYLFKQVVEPHALDDAGAICAAMIKSTRAKVNDDLRPLIDNYINWISTKEYRLADGTLARRRPQMNTLWLDDLYMSIPALAQMGKLTGEKKYFDDAVKQLRQFSQRMFIKEKGLYMHGWVEKMEPHPAFLWGRANGWALMATVELLDVLPADHPGRPFVLQLLREHAKGLAVWQSGSGFWHQLLNREGSYLETSATAIYSYCIAHACNKGWLDAKAYVPMSVLAWNAVTTRVNEKGQVSGTCVGTGMAFDPMFYYYRPTSEYAAHGYGPVLLAGSEMLRLISNYHLTMNDSSIQVDVRSEK